MNIKFLNAITLIISCSFPIIFALSFHQDALYFNNQNTYFAHGLASSGSGFLHNDWFIHTTDPFPVFSGLVSFIANTVGENWFHLIYFLLLGTFVYSILGIATIICGFKKTDLQYWLLFIFTTVLYSGFAEKIHYLFSPEGPLASGVAMQTVLSSNLQPSTFGAFVFLSIYLFLRDKAIFSIVCLAVAVSLHSSYFLSAAALTVSYLLITYIKSSDYRKPMFLGLLCLTLIMPILIYNLVNFSPTSVEYTHQAQKILVDIRIPHHAKITQWFDKWVIFRMLLIATAIYLVRKSDLFLILLVPFLTAVGLSVIQLMTNNYGLALLFPWRISVILVPIATIVISAHAISLIFKYFHSIIVENSEKIRVVLILAVSAISFFSIRQSVALVNEPRVGTSSLSKFIERIATEGNTFLAPIELGTLRLAARVPVFVDYKSHPYKDVELLEWFDRINMSKKIYDPKELNNACNELKNMHDKYAITHVVWLASHPLPNCPLVYEIYQDPDFIIYQFTKS